MKITGIMNVEKTLGYNQ